MSKEKLLPISVWLTPSRARLNFCMICRSNLHCQIEGYPKTVIFGSDASLKVDTYRPLQFPIRIRCEGNSQIYGRCPAVWIIQGFIDD